MSVTVFATSLVEHIELQEDDEETYTAICLERALKSIDLIIQGLAARGFRSFEDLCLRHPQPFLMVAETADSIWPKRCIEQEQMNDYYDEVVAVLFSGFRSEKVDRNAVWEAVLYKKAIDSTNRKCQIKHYWHKKEKKFGKKIELDQKRLDFPFFDLSPLAKNGTADSNQSVKVVHIKEGITDFYIRSEKSSYLPDMTNERWNMKMEPEKIAESEIYGMDDGKQESISESNLSPLGMANRMRQNARKRADLKRRMRNRLRQAQENQENHSEEVKPAPADDLNADLEGQDDDGDVEMGDAPEIR